MTSHIDIVVSLITVGLVIALGGLLAAWMNGRALRQRLNQVLDDTDRAIDRLYGELQDAETELTEARARLESHAAERAAALARLDVAEAARDAAQRDRDAAGERAEAATEAAREAEKVAALRSQEAEEMRLRMTDWERARSESLDAARSAVLETAQQVSSKLITDHRRESEAARRDTAERITRVTHDLVGQMQAMASSLVELRTVVGDQGGTLDTVWRALTSPGGAGYYAEIGLENTLTSFGLGKGRDFVMQYAVSGEGVRPDAVVFLPGDTVLVIDAKASKFLLELAEVEGSEREDAVRRDLARSMNEHLRQLSGKNYKSAVFKSWHDNGREDPVRRMLSIMYLPNEGAVEKVGQADPDFVRKAAQFDITVAGPTALASLVAFARIEIELERQTENHARIIEGTQLLMDAIGTFLEHAKTMGGGLQTSAAAYVRFAKSLNSTLLPRIRRLNRLGVRPSRSKPLPTHFQPFELVTIEQDGADVALDADERLVALEAETRPAPETGAETGGVVADEPTVEGQPPAIPDETPEPERESESTPCPDPAPDIVEPEPESEGPPEREAGTEDAPSEEPMPDDDRQPPEPLPGDRDGPLMVELPSDDVAPPDDAEPEPSEDPQPAAENYRRRYGQGDGGASDVEGPRLVEMPDDGPPGERPRR